MKGKGSNPISVLLIEDDLADIHYLKEILLEDSSYKFNIEYAGSISSALERIQGGNIDVILLDLFLPDCSGLTTFIELKPKIKEIPIIILTSLDDESLAIKAVKYGAQDYIIKWNISNTSMLAKTMRYSIERHNLLLEIERSSNNRFYKIIEKNADGIIIVDKSGFILFTNPSAETLFERSSQELIGEQFGYPLVDGETSEIDIVKKSGQIAIVEMQVVELSWEGDLVFLASLRDITERKETELLLLQSEKLASIGRIAAGIAHEINNPLTNVSIITHTLRERLINLDIPESILRKLDLIKKNIDRASSITKELLHFSKQKTISMSSLDINEVIESSLLLLESRLKNIIVHKNLSYCSDIMGDYLRLEQVCINIINNAVEAMNNNGDIFIATYEKGNHVIVEIRDTGCGISKETMPRLFEPFFSTKDTGSYVGLGLSICYSIIDEHKGHIKIDSRKEEGTTIIIDLPKDFG